MMTRYDKLLAILNLSIDAAEVAIILMSRLALGLLFIFGIALIVTYLSLLLSGNLWLPH